MVADDDVVVRDCTAQLLRQAGYECHTASSANEVCDLLTRCDFDLIIADIVMPGNTQLELLGELASLEGMPPLLLVTGHPTVETASKAVEARAVGYLTKPVDFEVLLRIVRREVDAHASRRFIRRRRKHLEGVLQDLRQIEAAVADPRGVVTDETLNTYLALLSEHILTAVSDLRVLIGVITARQGPETHQQLAGCRPIQLLDALRETITVLEKTKRSFKSKELADLRGKLETLLEAPAKPVLPPLVGDRSH